MAEIVIAGGILVGATTAGGGVIAGLRTTPSYPRSLKLLAGGVALATVCYVPNSFKVRRQWTSNKDVTKFLKRFDEPLLGAPLAVAGVFAASFVGGHGVRCAFSAARASIIRSGVKTKGK